MEKILKMNLIELKEKINKNNNEEYNFENFKNLINTYAGIDNKENYFDNQ